MEPAPYGGGGGGSDVSLDLRITTELAGHIIGKGGQRITEIRKDSGASLKIEKEEVRNFRGTFIAGKRDQVLRCIEWVFQDRDGEHAETLVEVLVPSAIVGCIIGKQGSSVAEIRNGSGARITVQRTPPGPQDPVRIVEVEGSYTSVRMALGIMLVKMDEEGKLSQHAASGGVMARRAAMTSAKGYVPQEFQAASFPQGRVAPAMQWGGGGGCGGGFGGGYGGGGGCGRGGGRGGGYGACGGAPMAHPAYGPVAGARGGYAAAASPYGGGFAPAASAMQGASPQGSLGGLLCFGCSNQVAGRLIGKGGAVITDIRKASGAKFKVEESTRPDAGERFISIDGNVEEVERCINRVFEILDDGYADSDRKGALGDNLEVVVVLPDKHAGAVIGKGGENIQGIRQRTNAKVKLVPDANRGAERKLTVGGSVADVREALMGVVETLFREVLC